MAAAAQHDIRKRVVEVNRLKLIETLESNRKKHVEEYEEAKTGYRDALVSKLDEAFAEAKQIIEKRYAKRRVEAAELTDAEIEKQQDYVSLFDGVTIQMKVPRSFAAEYDAAIDMAKWDVRETLELTHAEFTCFVRDQWDWKSDFIATSMLYNGPKKA